MKLNDFLADAPPPAWKIGSLIRFRKKLLAGFPVAVTTGAVFDIDSLQQVERYLLGSLAVASDFQDPAVTPDPRSPADKMKPAVHNWLCRYLGQPWSELKTAQLGSFAAGWIELFQAGVVPPVWSGKPAVWALISVKDLKRLQGREPNYQICLEVLAGPAAGIELSKHVPGGVIQSWLRELGAGAYVRTHPSELGGLMLCGILSRDTASGRLILGDVTANSSILGYNRKILKARKDLCKHPDYRGKPCFDCRLGRDRCSLSRHFETYPIGFCSNATVSHKGPLIGNWCTSCLERGFTPEPEKKLWKKE